MAEPHVAIADSRYLLAEVNRLKSQVQELRATNRVAQEERARTADLLASFVTCTQLDAALSTKVSLAHVNSQVDALRLEIATQLAQKVDLQSHISMQSSKLDVAAFNANTLDSRKTCMKMEQDARNLYATFVAQMENVLKTKVGVEDLIRVFSDPDGTSQEMSLEFAAFRFSNMMDQLKLLNKYVEEDRQRQLRFKELNGNMRDLKRKQTADWNAIVQLKNATQITKTQLNNLGEQTGQVAANLQTLAETRNEPQGLTQEEKNAQDARQAQLANEIEQLKIRSNDQTKKLNELEKAERLTSVLNGKLKDINHKVQKELTQANLSCDHHYQQLNEGLNKATEQLIFYKDRFVQLDACIRQLACLLKKTQGDLDTVRGPLATLATNLHEENVAIVQEIKRSQDGARNIMLDYQDLLDRGTTMQAVVPLPCRPLSTTSCSVSDTTFASRKHKQQTLLATKSDSNRPSTVKNRGQTCGAPNRASPLGVRQYPGASRTTRPPSLPWRAQTAGLISQVHSENTDLCGCRDNNDGLTKIGYHLQEVRPANSVETATCITNESKSPIRNVTSPFFV
ncbi:hypothetical protein Plhal710r2_c012g0056971 [Plasmopara halstedii]